MRATLFKAAVQHANRETVNGLEDISGRDVADVGGSSARTSCSDLFAHVRRDKPQTGRLEWSAGGHWKRRVRALLAVLAAHAHTMLTRDMAIDILWPEADGDSAVNNLNQTVFQLRRYLDPAYRQGESPDM